MPNPLVYNAADFTTSGGVVAPGALAQTFRDTSFPSTPVIFDYIDSDSDDVGQVVSVSVWFSGVPDAADEATSDGLIAAHAGVETADPGAQFVTPTVLPYAAAVDVDVQVGADFAIDALTGVIALSLINPYPGAQGLIYVRQDGTGGNSLSFVPPAGWTVQFDPALVDLECGQAPDEVTVYSYAFVVVGGLNLLHIAKSILS